MAKREFRQSDRILAPARPWFLKYALAYVIFLGVWLLVFVEEPNSGIAKMLTGLLLLGLIPILWFRKETRRERQFVAFVRLGLMLVVCVVGAIIDEPLIGILLLALSLGGILVYIIIRLVHRKDEVSSVRLT